MNKTKAISYLRGIGGEAIDFEEFKGKAWILSNTKLSGTRSVIRLLHEHLNNEKTLILDVKATYFAPAVKVLDLKSSIPKKASGRFKETYNINMPRLDKAKQLYFGHYSDSLYGRFMAKIKPRTTNVDYKEYEKYETIIVEHADILPLYDIGGELVKKLIQEKKHTIILLSNTYNETIDIGLDTVEKCELSTPDENNRTLLKEIVNVRDIDSKIAYASIAS